MRLLANDKFYLRIEFDLFTTTAVSWRLRLEVASPGYELETFARANVEKETEGRRNDTVRRDAAFDQRSAPRHRLCRRIFC